MAETVDYSWAEHAPYASPSKDFVKRFKGQCHCGQVTFWISRDGPLKSKYCHCHDCQIIHAAPFQWAAVFHKTDFAFDDLNPEHIRFYKSRNEGEFPSGKPALPCKISCSRCGSFLFDEGRNMIMLFPTSIRFDKREDMDKFKVECHLFYPSRVADVPDGKPKWTGVDNSSELMEDEP